MPGDGYCLVRPGSTGAVSFFHLKDTVMWQWHVLTEVLTSVTRQRGIHGAMFHE